MFSSTAYVHHVVFVKEWTEFGRNRHQVGGPADSCFVKLVWTSVISELHYSSSATFTVDDNVHFMLCSSRIPRGTIHQSTLTFIFISFILIYITILILFTLENNNSALAQIVRTPCSQECCGSAISGQDTKCPTRNFHILHLVFH